MNERSLSFVFSRFARYYREHSVIPPKDIPHREFAFMPFSGGMVRHRSFSTLDELMAYIRREVPAHVYYSSAYYERPTLPMEEKGWRGAELVFDIDADHIATSCKELHDKWTCLACGKSGKGAAPKECPSCGSKTLKEQKWICDECLAAAKEETTRLLEVLEWDFGFSSKEIKVYFSGRRGYHIHVDSKAVLQLDGRARAEIADYFTGVGYEIRRWPRLEDGGWNRRLVEALLSIVEDPSQIPDPTLAEEVRKRQEDLIERILAGQSVYVKRSIKKKDVKYLLELAKEKASIHIDTLVTTDTARLIRLPGSLHGGTGLLVCPVENIDTFDPLKESPVLPHSETVTVSVTSSPEVRLRDERFGPFENEVVELPEDVAVFLICSGVAEVVR